MSSTELRPPRRLVLLRGGRDVERELSRQEADWSGFCERIGWQDQGFAEDDGLEQRLLASIERRLAQPGAEEDREACEGRDEEAPRDVPRRPGRARFGVAALAVAALLGAAAATVVSWLARPEALPLPTRDAADGRPVAPSPIERSPSPTSSPRDELTPRDAEHRPAPRVGPPRVTPPGAREIARRTPALERTRERSQRPTADRQVRARDASAEEAAVRVEAATFEAIDLAAVDPAQLPSFQRRPAPGSASWLGSSRPAPSPYGEAAPQPWLTSSAEAASLVRASTALGGVSRARLEAAEPAPSPRVVRSFSLSPSRERWIGAATSPSDAAGDRRGGFGVMAQLDLGRALEL